MQFIEVAEMHDATGSEKIIAGLSILAEVMLDCRELLKGIETPKQ